MQVKMLKMKFPTPLGNHDMSTVLELETGEFSTISNPKFTTIYNVFCVDSCSDF